MSKKTLLLGGALIILGIASSLFTQNAGSAPVQAGVTGILMLIFGGVARLNEESEKKMFICAIVLAVLGLLITAPAWRFTIYMMSVGARHVEQPAVALTESVTAVFLAVYLYVSIAPLKRCCAKEPGRESV